MAVLSLTFLGLIRGALFFPVRESTLCAPHSSDQESYACKGQTSEAARCPCDTEVSLMLSGVVMLHLLSWLPDG